MCERRPVPRRESSWGMQDIDHRQLYAHHYNDQAEDVVQACFEGNPFKTVAVPFKLFWQCMRFEPGLPHFFISSKIPLLLLEILYMAHLRISVKMFLRWNSKMLKDGGADITVATSLLESSNLVVPKECPADTYRNISGSTRQLCRHCPADELPSHAIYFHVLCTNPVPVAVFSETCVFCLFPESGHRNLDMRNEVLYNFSPILDLEIVLSLQILKLTGLSLSLRGSWGSDAVAPGGVEEGAFGLDGGRDGSLAVSLIGAVSALGLFHSSLGGDGERQLLSHIHLILKWQQCQQCLTPGSTT
ncbi:hypothetical protein FNV43_RR12895 [Rhamnella rubrinervis]|uniref:DUF8003 domain-containing protein n=1 Tax=Rhamnella rubrinervis TaxID=2594499 RepID=A0A8K0MEJ1_9ROSA|nr:hypothetical protein FNV43_RR12895 [Rhamnella rubrinervis]